MRKYISFICIYIFIFFLWILLVPKGQEVLFFYENQSSALTGVFKGITFFGEWIGLVILALFILIKNYKNLLYVIIGWLPLTLIMTTMKRLLNFPRPLKYFQNGEIVPHENIQALYEFSMPSGHTFTAFFLASFLASFYRLKHSYQLGLFILAMLVGLSRMVLLLHFKEDVLVGSILGIIAGLIPYYLKKYRLTKS